MQTAFRLVRTLRVTALAARTPFFTGLLCSGLLCTGLSYAETAGASPPATPSSAMASQEIQSFISKNCSDCHTGEDAEAGLDFDSVGFELSDVAKENYWVRIYDRVREGEMPPPDSSSLDAEQKDEFLDSVEHWISSHQRQQQETLGRSRTRRLTRREIERSLQDLLGIDIPLANQLPEESRGQGFSTVGAGQAMSHFQLERHLAVVDIALDEAFRRAANPDEHYYRDLDPTGIARRNTRRRNREPELREGLAVTWSSNLIFYGRISPTRAPQDGWYHFTVTASGLKPPHTVGVWCTVRSGLCVSSAPLLEPITAFEAGEEPRTISFDAWLPRGHMVEIRPGDATLKRARFRGGQVGVGEGEPQDVPGVAMHRITMRRFYHHSRDTVRRSLFGILESDADAEPAGTQKDADTLKAALVRQLNQFATRAFRRPVTAEELRPFAELAVKELNNTSDLRAALRIGYRSLLCSPRFLYLTERPGDLDDFAIASRLSYFLTGSLPDDRLAELANHERLRDPGVLPAEVDRLLERDGGRQFLADLASEWLELDQINFTQPDRKLFPEFDSIVQDSMVEETVECLCEMLREDRPVSELIAANYTYLNSRLARHYGIPDVHGGRLRRVSLPSDSHRGGILTHGAILKVTANGTNTSPVSRGAWVSERLLGTPIPPPPENVPAVEPDIRGAKTIREQLAMHRNDTSCAACHKKIDPPGFALENFDPTGRWRDRYVGLKGRKRKRGAVIDASYQLPEGTQFANVDEFRELVAADSRALAINVAEKLLTYGSGAAVSFADRSDIEQIVDAAAERNFGFRSLLKAVVTSPTFLSK